MPKAADKRCNMFPHELNKPTFRQELTLFYVVLYAAVAASFLGHRVLYIQLPFFRLSSYRLLLLTIAFWLVYRLVVKKLAFSRIKPKSESSFSIWVFIIWTAYALVSFFWVRDRSGWFRAVFFIASGTFIIIVENYYFSSEKKIKTALFVTSIVIAVHNGIAWYEIITRNYHFVDSSRAARHAAAATRVPLSTLHNPNDLALVLVFGIVVAITSLLLSKKKFGKLFLALLALSSFILLIKTGSRGNVLGLGLGFLFAAAVLASKISMKKRILLIFSIIAALVAFEAVTGIIQELWREYFHSLTFNSESVRINLLKNGLVFVGRTGGFGVGAGNIEYWMEHYAVYGSSAITNMHNWWGELLTAYGVYFTLLYLVFYFRLFLSLFRKYRYSTERDTKVLAMGFMAFQVIFVLGSVSSSSNIIRDWLWVVWGILIAFQGIGKSGRRA
jgi:teichuronic acid biosynthesis protein TuaE